VLDKRMNLETARRLGIPCPAQFELERIEQLSELIEELGFPMVLKNPGPSARDGKRSPFRFRWLIARNELELRRHIAEHCPAGVFPLFQQLVTGAVRNVCCFACEGEITGAHEYQSIRRLRGMSAFREIVPVDAELRGYAESMLRELRWDGAAHLAFFVRESDGDVRYMETNGRFWAATAGSVAAGWDFPYWTFRYFAHDERPAPPASLGIGRKSRWAYGDLEALLTFLAGNDEVAGAGRSRLQAVADYASGFGSGIDSDVFRLDDPLPQLVEHWQAAWMIGSRVQRKLRDRLKPRDTG
jgi:predicted ATP-grasp superfamily ATP-dependent carboligase